MTSLAEFFSSSLGASSQAIHVQKFVSALLLVFVVGKWVTCTNKTFRSCGQHNNLTCHPVALILRFPRLNRDHEVNPKAYKTNHSFSLILRLSLYSEDVQLNHLARNSTMQLTAFCEKYSVMNCLVSFVGKRISLLLYLGIATRLRRARIVSEEV